MKSPVCVLAALLMCSGFALAQCESEICDRIVDTWITAGVLLTGAVAWHS
jgi:hypothetical protein